MSDYPTEWAYEVACIALNKHRRRADSAEEALAMVMKVADAVAIAFNTHLAAILNEDVTTVQASWGNDIELLSAYRDVRNRLDPDIS